MTCKCLCLKSQSKKKKHSSDWIIFFFFSLCSDDLRCAGMPLNHGPRLTSQRSSCVTNSDAAWMAGRDYFLHKQSLLIRYGWLMTTLKRKYKPTNHPTRESRKTIIYQLLTTKSSQCPDGHWLILKWLIKPPYSNSLWRGSFWEEEWRDLQELSQQDVCPPPARVLSKPQRDQTRSLHWTANSVLVRSSPVSQILGDLKAVPLLNVFPITST